MSLTQKDPKKIVRKIVKGMIRARRTYNRGRPRHQQLTTKHKRLRRIARAWLAQNYQRLDENDD